MSDDQKLKVMTSCSMNLEGGDQRFLHMSVHFAVLTGHKLMNNTAIGGDDEREKIAGTT